LPILIIHIATGFFLLQPFIANSNDKLAYIRSKLQAYYWIFTNIKKLRDKRYYIQHNIRRVPDSEIMKNMVKTSIWDLVVLAINILKFGRPKATLLYFNKGIRDIEKVYITDTRFR
jgi:hypothetical protein